MVPMPFISVRCLICSFPFDLASKSIGIPDPHGVYAFRIRTNVKRLKAEITALKTVEKEILARSNGNEHIKHLTEIKGIGTITATTMYASVLDFFL